MAEKTNNLENMDPYLLKKAEAGLRKYVKVKFADNRSYSYFCDFKVAIGDYVFVDGKRSGMLGEITDVQPESAAGRASSFTFYVLEAFKKYSASVSAGISNQTNVSDNSAPAAYQLNKLTLWSEVEFGRFRQGKTDAKRKLTWYVINRDRNQMTLLCKNLVKCLPFNDTKIKVTWENSTIRKYLNGMFYDAAFNEEEKQAIIEVPLMPALSDGKSVIQCRRTRDRVFLLDAETAVNLPADIRKGFLTLRALAENSYFSSQGLTTDDYCFWWLRNPGKTNNSAAIMGDYVSNKSVVLDAVGVRPVIVVNLNSALFGGHYEEIDIPQVFTEDEIRFTEEKEKSDKKKTEIAGRLEELNSITLSLYSWYSGLMAGSLWEIEQSHPEMKAKFRLIDTGYFDLNSVSADEYLKKAGIVFDPNKAVLTELTAFAMAKCGENEKYATLAELKEAHYELNDVFNELMWRIRKDYSSNVKEYFREIGLLYDPSDEAKDHKEPVQTKENGMPSFMFTSIPKVEKIEIADKKLEARVESIFKELEVYYPEHVIFALDSLTGKKSESISEIAKRIGYANRDEFFNAYGWRIISVEEVRQLRPDVVYKPGNEPEFLRTRINNLVKSLDEYYPDHVIPKSLQTEHKSISKTISGFYQWFGYESAAAFLKAYGFDYHVKAGGRPTTVDSNEIIDILKERTKDKPYSSVTEMKKDNPDLSGKLKTLMNKSNEYFGMTLSEYLKQQGIIEGKPHKVHQPTAEDESGADNWDRLNELIEKAKEAGLIAAENGGSAESVRENVGKILQAYRDKIMAVPQVKTSNTDTALPANQKRLTVTGSRWADDSHFAISPETERIVIKNPACRIGSGFRKMSDVKADLVYEVKADIDEYLKTCADYYSERKQFIEFYISCIEQLKQSPDEIWTDDSYRLILIVDKTVYQTEIGAIGDDFEIVDNILCDFFNAGRVIGKVKYNNDYSEYMKSDLLLKIGR